MKSSLHNIRTKAACEKATIGARSKTHWKHILVPVDFSENFREALKLAVTLAANPKDQILLLHVIEPEHPLQRGNAVTMSSKREASQIQLEAQERLQRWAAQEAGPDIEVETVVRLGNVTDEVVALAESPDCDVIVMAIEPQGWVYRLFPTPVAAKLQHCAVCVVIAIRPHTPVVRERLCSAN